MIDAGASPLTMNDAGRYGSIAATARLLQRPENLLDLSANEVDFFFRIQEDVILRKFENSTKFSGTHSAPKSDTFWRRRTLIPIKIQRKIRRFFRQNVREYRRSRVRMSGLRSVVLWPLVALFYLSGVHRVRATRSGKAVLKFVRQNVREYRRSRVRMSGLRSVVLWPLVALFYLSGVHRVRATRSGKAVLKFVRQNVREYRRSRVRMSGLRSVVLWPLAALFYLSGVHRVRATRPGKAEPSS
jgi:transposase-like protein